MGQGRTTWRILVVDDDERVARSLQEGLAVMPGCEVCVATSGKQALACLARAPFDLVITDFKMPRMSGMTLAAHIHQLYPQTAIAMLTAHDSAALREEAARIPILAILEKPIALGRIRRAVRELLQQHSACGAQYRPLDGRHVRDEAGHPPKAGCGVAA